MSIAEQSILTLSLKDNSVFNEDVIVTKVVGQEEISKPFRFEITFTSSDTSLEPGTLVGQEIQFNLSSRPFHGLGYTMTAGKIDDPTQTTPRRVYRLLVVPGLEFLKLRTDCRVFTNQTVPQIIETILSEHSTYVKNTGLSTMTSPPNRVTTIQYRESCFDFINRLCEQEGLFYYFTFDSSSHTVVFGNKATDYEQIQADDLSTASYPFEQMTGDVVPSDKIAVWKHHFSLHQGKWTLNDYDYNNPTANKSTSASSTMSDRPSLISNLKGYGFGHYAITSETDSRLGSDNDTTREALLHLEEKELVYDQVKGVSGCLEFSPGYYFDFESLLTPASTANAEDGTYALLKVSHHAQTTQSDGSGNQSVLYSNEFEGLPKDVVYRPPIETPIPRISGVHNAVVVNSDGTLTTISTPETDEEGLGRVKVAFHWQRQTESGRETNNSGWIRVSQQWAGQGYGMVAIPHVGQEVLVSFENGNIDRPVIVGRVYNSDTAPSLSLPDEQYQMWITDQVGNIIKLRGETKTPQIEISTVDGDSGNDADKMATVLIVGAKNSNLSLDVPDPATTSEAETTATESVGNGINFSTDGSFDLVVSGQTVFDFDSDFLTNVGTNALMNVNGNYVRYVDKIEYLLVEGSLIEKINTENDGNQIPNSTESYGRKTTVYGNDDLRIKASADGNQSGANNVDIANNYTININGKYTASFSSNSVTQTKNTVTKVYNEYYFKHTGGANCTIQNGFKLTVNIAFVFSFQFPLSIPLKGLAISIRPVESKNYHKKNEYILLKCSVASTNIKTMGGPAALIAWLYLRRRGCKLDFRTFKLNM